MCAVACLQTQSILRPSRRWRSCTTVSFRTVCATPALSTLRERIIAVIQDILTCPRFGIVHGNWHGSSVIWEPPGFGYVTGRSRIGRTALLRQAVERAGGLYHQAIEGPPCAMVSASRKPGGAQPTGGSGGDAGGAATGPAWSSSVGAGPRAAGGRGAAEQAWPWRCRAGPDLRQPPRDRTSADRRAAAGAAVPGGAWSQGSVKYSPVSRQYSEVFKIESSLPLTFRPAILRFSFRIAAKRFLPLRAR